MNLTKATVILRGYDVDQVRVIAGVLKTSKKIKNMEVTLNTPGAIESIRALSQEFGDELNIGAGTVLNYEQLVLAVEAGARFVLAPNMMTKAMIDYCKANHVISIPGAFTPSEIATMFEYGADIVKVFPANELSISYAKKVCEPLGDLNLMAVGGVNKDNVEAHFKSGYQFVGSAGGIFKKEDILSENVDGLTRSMQEFEAGIPE